MPELEVNDTVKGKVLTAGLTSAAEGWNSRCRKEKWIQSLRKIQKKGETKKKERKEKGNARTMGDTTQLWSTGTTVSELEADGDAGRKGIFDLPGGKNALGGYFIKKGEGKKRERGNRFLGKGYLPSEEEFGIRTWGGDKS